MNMMSEYSKSFEIWQSHDSDCISTGVCLAGAGGDAARALNEPGSKLVHRFDAWSELDQMQKYYDYMEFGVYTSEWPDLAVRPFFFVDALAHLQKLKKPLKALSVFSIMADGSTQPTIPNPIPRILVQDRAVFAVNIWISGDFGGTGEPPLNETELIEEAHSLVMAQAPHVLKRDHNTSLICPLAIAEQMTWPPYGATTPTQENQSL